VPFAAVNNNTDNKKEEAGPRMTKHETRDLPPIVLVVNSITSHHCDPFETCETCEIKHRTNHIHSTTNSTKPQR
jgi:hypothetical protein